MKITIKTRIWEAGNSAVITIPAHYLNQGLLKVGQEYIFEIREEEQNEGDTDAKP